MLRLAAMIQTNDINWMEYGCTDELSVSILFQWFRNQFSFKETLHFTQGWSLLMDFKLNINFISFEL